jgi:MOSC domain-containing protein YiiM
LAPGNVSKDELFLDERVAFLQVITPGLSREKGEKLKGVVEEVYVAKEGSAVMERVEEVNTIEGCGIEGGPPLRGDRVLDTLRGRVRGVTLISSEDLDHIESELGICVKKGEHRRNIVARGIRLDDLRRKRFRVGETVLEYERPRPPCRHVQDLTEPGMTRAL